MPLSQSIWIDYLTRSFFEVIKTEILQQSWEEDLWIIWVQLWIGCFDII